MKKYLPVLITAAVFLSNAAFAEKDCHRKEQKEMKKMMRALDLTEAQKKKLRTLQKESREKAKSLRSKVKTAREDLQKAFIDDASPEKLTAARKQVKQFLGELGDLRFEKVLQIREVLTKDQRKRFHEMKKDHKRGHCKQNQAKRKNESSTDKNFS